MEADEVGKPPDEINQLCLINQAGTSDSALIRIFKIS